MSPAFSARMATRGVAIDTAAEVNGQLQKDSLRAAPREALQRMCHGHLGEEIIRACAGRLATEHERVGRLLRSAAWTARSLYVRGGRHGRCCLSALREIGQTVTLGIEIPRANRSIVPDGARHVLRPRLARHTMSLHSHLRASSLRWNRERTLYPAINWKR